MVTTAINTSLIDLLPNDINRIYETAAPFPSIYNEEQAIGIAECGKIEIDFIPLRKINGILVKADKYYIIVNSTLSEPERTKAILHEIGHYIMHYDNRFTSSIYCHQDLVNQIEKEADFFAWILMDDYIKERCGWNFFIL